MTLPLVDQLRFTRTEWERGLEGVTEEEALLRFKPMNSISWIVGHLAWQEQRYWLKFAQDKVIFPELDELVGFGKPASSPSYTEMLDIWREVTSASDPFLDTLSSDTLESHFNRSVKGGRLFENVGTLLLRMTYHYWYHIGEIQAVRQMLGHLNLPQFVGEIGVNAPFRVEIHKIT